MRNESQPPPASEVDEAPQGAIESHSVRIATA